jgi:hypothetical protein
MTTRKEARSKVEVITRKRRTRRTTLTRKIRRKMRIGRRPSVDASTTWHGETTRNQTADLAKTPPTCRTAASTKSRPKPPWQPSTPSVRL